MDWKDCMNKKIVRSGEVDTELIKSLMLTSKNKLLSANLLDLNETTSASKLSLCYDSLRELLEALAISKGYKIYNHECYTSFLKEIIKNLNLAEKFDRLRLLRNSINYYGQNINIKETEEAINELNEMVVEIKKLIKFD
jgi:hypothetical protein